MSTVPAKGVGSNCMESHSSWVYRDSPSAFVVESSCRDATRLPSPDNTDVVEESGGRSRVKILAVGSELRMKTAVVNPL